MLDSILLAICFLALLATAHNCTERLNKRWCYNHTQREECWK